MTRLNFLEENQPQSALTGMTHSVMNVQGWQWLQGTLKGVIVAGLLAMAIPAQPARAANNYQECASRLLKVGLQAETVADACAGALYPEKLASCVTNINRRTDINAIDALTTCRRVRRPQELASCVIDISRFAPVDLTTAVLENCRRSLLPKQYASCVVGLNRRIDMSALSAMAVCIDASDRIVDFDPTFIPKDQLPAQPVPPLSPTI
jgi:hypothetical protein